MNQNENVEREQPLRGVYFLANDRVLPLCKAFLNSFRLHNPEIALCLIPFREDIEELKELALVYSFSIFDNPELLNRCDEISRVFHSRTTGHYRKLACWSGPFDEFIYIDIDMLVLKNVKFVFPLLSNHHFVVSWSNLPQLEQWVWKPEIRKCNLLEEHQITFAANTGFFCSKKNALRPEEIERKAVQASEIKTCMELSYAEQAFLNYLIVTSGKKYTSLYSLLDTPEYPENFIEFWAGNPGKHLLSGFSTFLESKKRDIFLIHWAGCWQPTAKEIKWFNILRRLKIKQKMWSVSLLMPLRKLWKTYYRMKLDIENNSLSQKIQ